MVAGGDRIRKSEDEADTRRTTFGGPLDEGNVVEWDWRDTPWSMRANGSEYQ